MQSPLSSSLRPLALALLLALPAAAQAQNADSAALTQQELEQINNKPITSTSKAQNALNQPVEPSFVLKDTDGTQVTEYRYRDKGRATDIHVKSGVGTSYNMSRPEDGAPQERDRSINRVPSVKVIQF